MDKDLKNHCEQLSALMDGELDGEALAHALRLAHDEESQATWELYHVVGDVLRSPELDVWSCDHWLARWWFSAPFQALPRGWRRQPAGAWATLTIAGRNRRSCSR